MKILVLFLNLLGLFLLVGGLDTYQLDTLVGVILIFLTQEVRVFMAKQQTQGDEYDEWDSY